MTPLARSTLDCLSIGSNACLLQLLARTVNTERPDLEQQRSELVQQQNEFTIKLKQLEDNLLYLLANAEGDILADENLIISLEETKATSNEIASKVIVAQETNVNIAKSREFYRQIAQRGSLIYFLIDQLSVIDHMYQYSLLAFTFIFQKALDLSLIHI